jgi:alanyl-tRNA synthetase
MRLSGNEVRQSFLRYFEERGHTIVASSSLVPRADPTLLFTNAGMVQFKDVFVGAEARSYTRAASAQKCVRAGGKHNDLENVGHTGRHHTFFEMLGNFSFGDYFKPDAIAFAWDLLTGPFGLPADRLWVTIHEGDPALGLGPDAEARDLWRRHVPAERIVACPTKDNFWAMGDTGPCGPCSEILLDQGPALGCGRPTCAVGCDCDRYLELWNLVFMQFERSPEGTLAPLPKPSIDTGAGLERLAAVLQGVPSNFSTDLLRPLIARIEALAGKAYGADARADVSMRVIADHARAITFLIADGVMPGNEGRGYVLRRILRRAVRHGRLLGLEGPFLAAEAEAVVGIMRGAYPELEAAQARVAREVVAEEERFAHTLRGAIPRLEERLAALEGRAGASLAGDELFRLYDTYGLPRDLVEEIAAEHGVRCDWAGFEAELARAREATRDRSGKAFEAAAVPDALRELSRGLRVSFEGYRRLEAEAEVVALVKDGRPADAAAAGETVGVVLDRTPFYAEAGGQVGDTGTLEGEACLAQVEDTQRPLPGLTVHRATVLQGTQRRGARVTARVDGPRRALTVKNHTATHLLHEALFRVLGDHVRQEGSLVAPDRLRFDFRHFGPLTGAELHRVEELANAQVWKNLAVQEEELAYEEAVRRGAKAFFADKYGDRVRLITVEDPGQFRSLELCGGTHAKAVGEIGLIKIVAEGGVAAGVRRLEATTGPGAYDYQRRQEAALRESADLLKAKPLELPERVGKFAGEARELERELERLRHGVARRLLDEALASARPVEGVTVVATRADDLDVKGLRDLGDLIKAKVGTGVVVLAAAGDRRVSWVVMVTKDLTVRLHAGKLAKALAEATGGGGGGRPDLAEAGGKDPARLPEALAGVPALVARQLRAT